MKKFYLSLRDGRSVRLVLNLEYKSEFTKHTGKPIDFFIAGLLQGDYMILESMTLAWLMAIEGEKVEGKDLGLNKNEFGRLMEISTITKFLEIFPKMAFPEN